MVLNIGTNNLFININSFIRFMCLIAYHSFTGHLFAILYFQEFQYDINNLYGIWFQVTTLNNNNNNNNNNGGQDDPLGDEQEN